MLAVGCSSESHEKEEAPELSVTVDQVPAAAHQTMQREAEGGNLTEFEKTTKDGKTVYEADAQIASQTYEIQVAEDGTLLKKKLEKPEKDEKDEQKEGDQGGKS